MSRNITELEDSMQNGIIVTHDTQATPEAIWDAWTDPSSIARWWGPEGFTSTVRELDVRAGGRLDVVMHGPDGTDFENVYVFDAVDRPNRIAYTNQGSKDWGLAPFSSVVDIEKHGVLTKLTMTTQYENAEEYRRHVEDFHAIEGAQQLLERLGAAASHNG